MMHWRLLPLLVVSLVCAVACGKAEPSPAASGTIPTGSTPTGTEPAKTQASTLSITSSPDGEALVDGKVVGTTPIENLAAEPGERAITIRRKGFTEWTQTVSVGPGDTSAVAANLVIADPTDPEALAAMAASLEIEPVEVEAEETLRSAGAKKAVIPVFPRGDMRTSDLDQFRIDVTEEFEPSGKLEFRIGKKVVHSEVFDPESFATTRPFPDTVVAAMTPGKTVTWGYYPEKGKPVVTKFKIQKRNRQLERRLEKLEKRMEGQSELVRDQMMAQLWLNKRLYYAAYRGAASVVNRAEHAPQSLTIMQCALRRMKLEGSAAWTEIEDKVSRLPSRFRLPLPTR